MISKLKYLARKYWGSYFRIYNESRYIVRNLRYYKKFKIINSSHSKLSYPNTLFFVIDPYRKHPGLADRMKAIIACYNEAKLNGLQFKIVFKIPFKLEDYLKPSFKNRNWIASYSDLEYNIWNTRFVNEIKGWHLKAISGHQYHCYNYTGDVLPEVFENSGQRWADLFNELFTPSDEILQAIEKTGLAAHTYSAVHLRFVNALESFEEGHYNSLKTEEEKIALIQRCKEAIKKIISNHCDDKILVFSDSKRFLNSISDLPVLTLDSKSVGHVCFNDDKDSVAKAFLDQYMISRANKVYMITAPEMYSSSCFALCGARMGGAPFECVKV